MNLPIGQAVECLAPTGVAAFVTTVMRYRSIEEAVALANDTEFGLTASVIAGSEEEGMRIAAQVNAGSVFVQDTFLTFAKLRRVGTHSFGVLPRPGV